MNMQENELDLYAQYHISTIWSFQDRWSVELERITKVLDLQEKNLEDARNTLEKVDQNNPKALRAATNAVEHFERWVARLKDEEIPALRGKLDKSLIEVQFYHSQVMKKYPQFSGE